MCVLLLVVSVLAIAPTASAATVGVGDKRLPQPVFRAAPGEFNDVAVTRDGDDFVFADRANPVRTTEGEGCVSLDEQTVRCGPFPVAAVELDDGADHAVVVAGVTVDGGDGDDQIAGLSADGGAGDDRIARPLGEGDVMTATGGHGDDLVDARMHGVAAGANFYPGYLDGGPGRDQLFGSEVGANDLKGGPDSDVIIGGTGSGDVASFAGEAAVVIDLADDRPDGPAAAPDVLRGVEGAIGSSHDDVLRGTDGPNELHGGDGVDLALGRGGDDLLLGDGIGYGGTAGDRLAGGPGDDRLSDISRGRDDLLAGPGDDELHANESSAPETEGPDRLVAGSGDDVLTAAGAGARLDAGPGADTVNPGPRSRVVSCGSQPDWLAVAAPQRPAPRDCERLRFKLAEIASEVVRDAGSLRIPVARLCAFPYEPCTMRVTASYRGRRVARTEVQAPRTGRSSRVAVPDRLPRGARSVTVRYRASDNRGRFGRYRLVLRVVGSAPPASARSGVVASSKAWMGITAHGGALAWSRFRPATKDYRLMIRQDGRTRPARVPSRTRFFDVDLGTDRNGDVVATYSRCRRETPFNPVSQGLGCDLFAYSLVDKVERRLRGSSTRKASETQPTMSGGTLGFVRVHERRRGLAGVVPHITLRQGDRERAVQAGPRGVYSGLRYAGGRRPPPPRVSDAAAVEGPSFLQMTQRGLVFQWDASLDSDADCAGGALQDGRSQALLSQIRTSLPARAIDQGCDSSPVRQVFAPTASGTSLVYWADIPDPSTGVSRPYLRRSTPSGLEEVPLPDDLGTVVGTAVSGDRLFLEVSRRGRYDIVATSLKTFFGDR